MISRKSIFGARIYLKTLQTELELHHYVDWLNDSLVNAHLEARFLTHSWKSVKNFIENRYRLGPFEFSGLSEFLNDYLVRL